MKHRNLLGVIVKTKRLDYSDEELKQIKEQLPSLRESTGSKIYQQRIDDLTELIDDKVGPSATDVVAAQEQELSGQEFREQAEYFINSGDQKIHNSYVGSPVIEYNVDGTTTRSEGERYKNKAMPYGTESSLSEKERKEFIIKAQKIYDSGKNNSIKEQKFNELAKKYKLDLKFPSAEEIQEKKAANKAYIKENTPGFFAKAFGALSGAMENVFTPKEVKQYNEYMKKINEEDIKKAKLKNSVRGKVANRNEYDQLINPEDSTKQKERLISDLYKKFQNAPKDLSLNSRAKAISNALDEEDFTLKERNDLMQGLVGKYNDEQKKKQAKEAPVEEKVPEDFGDTTSSKSGKGFFSFLSGPGLTKEELRSSYKSPTSDTLPTLEPTPTSDTLPTPTSDRLPTPTSDRLPTLDILDTPDTSASKGVGLKGGGTIDIKW